MADLRGNLRLDRASAGVLVGLGVLAASLGALDAWTYRHTMNPDGISYIEIGEAYLSADIGAAINAYWSPLYPLILGSTLAILPESVSTEFALTRLANFSIYLAALAAFAFFISELLRYRSALLPGESERLLPPLAVWAVGVVAFIWGVMRLIGPGIMTPDLLVAVTWLLATALLLRAIRQPTSRRTLVALGAVLGLGFLAKTPMLFIALGFVIVAAAMGSVRQSLSRALVVAAALAAVALPFVIAISVDNGGPTWGTSSKLNYVWRVNEVPFVLYPGDPGSDALRNPPVRVLDRPPTFAFGEPVPGTVPLWYDPTYWFEGIEPRFNLGQQRHALRRSVDVYWDVLESRPGPELLIGFALLFVLGLPKQLRPLAMLSYLRFLAPLLLAIALYTPVVVEPRYIGAGLAVLVVGSFSALRVPTGDVRRRVFTWGFVVVMLAAMWPLVRYSVDAAVGGNANVEKAQRYMQNEREAASALRGITLGEGDRLAIAGERVAVFLTYFPRLARKKVVATVIRAPVRWRISPREKAALRRAGANAVVVRDRAVAGTPGWRRLGGSSYYLYRL